MALLATHADDTVIAVRSSAAMKANILVISRLLLLPFRAKSARPPHRGASKHSNSGQFSGSAGQGRSRAVIFAGFQLFGRDAESLELGELVHVDVGKAGR